MKNIKAFTMPKWGIEMQEGTISEWVVKEGHIGSKIRTNCLPLYGQLYIIRLNFLAH